MKKEGHHDKKEHKAMGRNTELQREGGHSQIESP